MRSFPTFLRGNLINGSFRTEEFLPFDGSDRARRGLFWIEPVTFLKLHLIKVFGCLEASAREIASGVCIGKKHLTLSAKNITRNEAASIKSIINKNAAVIKTCRIKPYVCFSGDRILEETSRRNPSNIDDSTDALEWHLPTTRIAEIKGHHAARASTALSAKHKCLCRGREGNRCLLVSAELERREIRKEVHRFGRKCPDVVQRDTLKNGNSCRYVGRLCRLGYEFRSALEQIGEIALVRGSDLFAELLDLPLLRIGLAGRNRSAPDHGGKRYERQTKRDDPRQDLPAIVSVLLIGDIKHPEDQSKGCHRCRYDNGCRRDGPPAPLILSRVLGLVRHLLIPQASTLARAFLHARVVQP